MDPRPLYTHGLGIPGDPKGMPGPSRTQFVSCLASSTGTLDSNYVASLRKFINDENWYLNLNRARHLEPHARFVRPRCIHSRQMDISQGTQGELPDDPQLALYVSASLPL